MYRKTICGLITLAITLLLLAPARTALAADSDFRVRADLSGASLMSGQAKYRERIKNNVLEQRFSVEIEDGQPGAMLMIDVNGVTLGVIVLDEFGFGDLQFRTSVFIDNPGDGSPIPTGFPSIQIGDVITVGDIGGVFN